MKLFLLLLVLYLAGGFYLYFFQEKIIFRPDLAPKDVELPKGARHLFLDGLEVGYLDRKSDTTIFYFGGNANNALEILQTLYQLPFNVVTFNYPGYGKSKGTPSQKSIFEGAKKIFEHFKTKKNIVIGRSLGTGVAAYIASLYPVDGVILITPYHSITHLAKMRYPIYPVSLLVKHPFETYRYIQKTDTPVIVILAQHDDTTPPSTFIMLRPYIKNLVKTVTIQGTNHGDILTNPKTQEELIEDIYLLAGEKLRH